MKIVDGRELMGRNEYARHRGERSPNAVRKAEQSGRIAKAVIRDASGELIGIDWRLADELWARHTDVDQAERNGKLVALARAPATATGAMTGPAAASADVKTAVAGGDAAAGAANSEAAPGDPDLALVGGAGTGGALAAGAGAGDQGDYLAARAKREGYLAKQAELDYLEQIGRLVPSEEVEREVAEIFSQLKSNVFLISDRKAQILAAEGDPVRVHRLLSDEFRTVFDEFSGRLASEAAAGAAEREAAGP
jgi:hypothetical protein